MRDWMGLNETFEKCLKCNACVANCPVTATTFSFGGPKHLGPELTRLIENQSLIDDQRIEYCTLCGTCDRSCPENVPVSTLMAHAKMRHTEQTGSSFRDFVLSNAAMVGKLASTFAPMTNLAMHTRPVRVIMEKVMHMAADRQFPAYRFRSFDHAYGKRLKKAAAIRQVTQSKRKVAYFVGCYAMYNAPEVADSFIQVMRFNGISVIKPKQKCCGIPMLANGRAKAAEKNAAYNCDQLLHYVNQGYDVVTTCTSCGLALKKDYRMLLNNEQADELADHVYDASEYLRMLKENGELNEQLAAVKQTAGYHAPCHMRAQAIGSPSLDILELIPGYTITDLAAGCCGQCGTFGFKKEKYAVSLQIGQQLAKAVEMLNAETTITECGMCKNQLDQLTDKPVLHPLQVLAASYQKAAAENGEAQIAGK
ncbi:MAG: anaerobic glycerol-3-phosphate dehydrogenase subunit C [Sporolactobacillus sp.]